MFCPGFAFPFSQFQQVEHSYVKTAITTNSIRQKTKCNMLLLHLLHHIALVHEYKQLQGVLHHPRCSSHSFYGFCIYHKSMGPLFIEGKLMLHTTRMVKYHGFSLLVGLLFFPQILQFLISVVPRLVSQYQQTAEVLQYQHFSLSMTTT